MNEKYRVTIEFMAEDDANAWAGAHQMAEAIPGPSTFQLATIVSVERERSYFGNVAEPTVPETAEAAPRPYPVPEALPMGPEAGEPPF